MNRNIRTSEKWLLFGYSLIMFFMISQDLIPLGPLNDIKAIAADRSINEILVVTLIGLLQIMVLMMLIIFFIGKRYPIWAKIWLVIHPVCIFIGVLLDWWIPYFFGYGAAERVERYQQIFGNTHAFLPAMNGIVPNTLHIIFHITLLLCIILSIYIFLTNRKSHRVEQRSGQYV